MATRKDTPAPTAAAAPARRRSTASIDEPAVPPTGGGQGAPVPTVTPENGYLLVCHPDRWGVIEGMVVPLCNKISLNQGANNVDVDSAGRFLVEQAIAEAKLKGGTVIRWDVDGPGTSYLKKVKGVAGFVSKWETLFPGSSNRRVDAKGYAQWLRSLIERNLIDGPESYTLEAMIEGLRSRIAAITGKPAYEAKLKQAVADLAVVEKELAAIEQMPAEDDDELPQLAG